MRKLFNNKHALFSVYQALLIFFVLFLMLVAVVLFYDFSGISMANLAFILALVSLVLISKNIYDLSKAEELDGKVSKKTNSDTVTDPRQKLLSVVYDNSPIAYLVIDSKGFIITANKATVRMLGRSTSQLNNTNFFSYLGSDNKKNEHTILLKEKFFNGVIIADEEVQFKKSKNNVYSTLSILKLDNSIEREASLVTLVDITKQKEVDVAKSEFVSLASHQLRTPIAGMRWSAELLLMDEDRTLSKQQRRYIERLLSNVKRMADLIDDFLQVSRFELGTREAELGAVNVGGMLDQIVEDQAVTAKGKKIVVEKSYDDNMSKIITDEKLLRMVVANIYNNAIKYSRVSGQIKLSCYKKENELFISVKDNGIGIPTIEQSKIFSKVFRASNATREVPDGTGLGLYIAKKAAEVLRGRITFISTEGIGSTFTLVLPLTTY